ncbi:ferritin-like domain-containing protein [Streptomyces sp. NPDC001339]|uniref:ferritin-like domain-containing protein n=1 Tax=Streptomyces sp. NPDC001339 TaxID=3364563 RepID=UPI003684AE0B
MLSVRKLFLDIHDNDEAFQLLCTLTAAGRACCGGESERIAALVTDPELAHRITRHGDEENEHARVFHTLLRGRGLEAAQLCADLDYMAQLEERGLGFPHDRLRDDAQTLCEEDVIAYLSRSRVTEQRGAAELRLMQKALAERPEVHRALTSVTRGEARHLAYAQEELLRLADGDRRRSALVRRSLRRTALAEIRVHRDVSLAMMSRMGAILGWSWTRRRLLTFSIRMAYLFERCGGWRRLTSLRMPPPGRRTVLGRPAAAGPRGRR